MKKFIFLIVFVIFTGTIDAQVVRWYPQSNYCTDIQGDRKYKEAAIGIVWTNNEATTIDNIDVVSFPDGWVKALSYPKFVSVTKSGAYMYKFRAEDEEKKEIWCYIFKKDQDDLFFIVHYANVDISFKVNLLNFYVNND